MKYAVEKATAAAIEFWSGIAGLDNWTDGVWSVHKATSDPSANCNITVFGRSDTGGAMACFEVHPREDGGTRESVPPSALRALVPFLGFYRLYWPGPQDTLIWTKTQIAVHLIQRFPRPSQEYEAYLWEECLAPAIRRVKFGQECLEAGTLGFECLRSVVRNYALPSGPHGFRKYIQRMVARAGHPRKKRVEIPTTVSLESPYWARRFQAFLRQRKQRGEQGLWNDGERVTGLSETLVRLASEWGESLGRRAFVQRVAAKMVAIGAAEESAKRQVRRWLKQADGPAAAHVLFEEWRRRRVDGPRSMRAEGKNVSPATRTHHPNMRRTVPDRDDPGP